VAKRKHGKRRARGAAPSVTAERPERRPAPTAARETRDARPAPREIGAYGERPDAPWHPWPLSEILIFVGAIAVLVGLVRGPERNVTTIVAGVGAVALGTIEVSIREHFSGYRSHVTLLAVIPVIVLHSAIVLSVAAVTTVPRVLNFALLALDAAVLLLLVRWLRARFAKARQERVRAAGRA